MAIGLGNTTADIRIVNTYTRGYPYRPLTHTLQGARDHRVTAVSCRCLARSRTRVGCGGGEGLGSSSRGGFGDKVKGRGWCQVEVEERRVWGQVEGGFGVKLRRAVVLGWCVLERVRTCLYG